MKWDDFGVLESELITDENTGKTFGESDQFKILGWSGKIRTAKKYFCRCSICSKDSELFGEGIFAIPYYILKSGSLPCGCGKLVKWTKEQNRVRIDRECSTRGYIFLGFVEPYTGVHSKIKLDGPYGYSENTIMANFMIGQACSNRRIFRIKESLTEEMEVTLEKIFKTGRFPEGTIFCKSEKQGHLLLKCPECGSLSESKSHHLKDGRKPCCSYYRQKEAYILLVRDSEIEVALKFGIANNTNLRVQALKNVNKLDFDLLGTWIFLNESDCKSAEKACFLALNTGIVGKDFMKEGFTETTTLNNFDNIVKIYEKFNGKLKKQEEEK